MPTQQLLLLALPFLAIFVGAAPAATPGSKTAWVSQASPFPGHAALHTLKHHVQHSRCCILHVQPCTCWAAYISRVIRARQLPGISCLFILAAAIVLSPLWYCLEASCC